MVQLMKLEFKKYQLKKHVWGMLIANFIIFLIMLIPLAAIKTETEEPVSYEQLLLVIDVFVRGTFLIYSSVIMSIIVMDEYEKKTIYQLFSYPIPRQKIIFAKLLIVAMFACLGILVGEILVTTGVVIVNEMIHSITEPFTYEMVARLLPCYLAGIISSIFLSVVPYTFGMKKKSSQSVIVSSIIIVVFLCSSINGPTGGMSIFIRELVLGILAVCMTVGSVMKNVRHIEEKDV
ncbi:ABC transporter permease [Anaerosporobacter faecicola]|uniref:ABC transporter permease n=1 Tax=Anaerosporobacter faecicola TaxID=2718714 RepID=UPI0014399ABF|nr:ABC transporter permease [Anaerosporobacter faecicola]